jgi:NADH-quinone oxidoreductase subunit M
MVQKVIYGDAGAVTANAAEISGNRQWALVILALIVLVLGVYPQPLIELTKDTVQAIIVNR